MASAQTTWAARGGTRRSHMHESTGAAGTLSPGCVRRQSPTRASAPRSAPGCPAAPADSPWSTAGTAIGGRAPHAPPSPCGLPLLKRILRFPPPLAHLLSESGRVSMQPVGPCTCRPSSHTMGNRTVCRSSDGPNPCRGGIAPEPATGRSRAGLWAGQLRHDACNWRRQLHAS